MGKSQNDRLFNHFQVIGTCLTELIQDKDAHGKVNYTLHIKTDGEYPVEVRVHFYALNSDLRNIAYKGHRVKVSGSLQGKLYSQNPDSKGLREWLQLRGSFITIYDDESQEPVEDMESAVMTEDDLPF
mgnify:CR=1 FL=1